MSKHIHDNETPAKHLRRRMTRWYKFFKNIPISIDDISVVQMAERSGTSYEARRDKNGGWAVYRIYRVLYDRTSYATQHETQGVGLQLDAALNLLGQKSPEAMARNTGVYNHPVQVAKLIRHEIEPPAG